MHVIAVICLNLPSKNSRFATIIGGKMIQAVSARVMIHRLIYSWYKGHQSQRNPRRRVWWTLQLGQQLLPVVKAIQQGSPASGDMSTSAGKFQLCTYRAHMYTRAHTSAHTQAYTHTHICACTHTRAHTHTHTHTHKWCMEIVTHDTSLSGIT